MATSQTIAQPRFSEYPLSGTAAAKRLWTSDGWDVYLPEGKKQRLLTMFWTHPHLETSSSNSGPFRPPGSIFARPTLQTATGPAVVATAGESLGGTQARSPGTMWALVWSSWRVNHKGCCGCCLDGFLFQVLVPTSQFGWIPWGKYNLKLSIGRWCQVDVDIRSKYRWQSRQPHDYFP
jgi:hypothetical protein